MGVDGAEGTERETDRKTERNRQIVRNMLLLDGQQVTLVPLLRNTFLLDNSLILLKWLQSNTSCIQLEVSNFTQN